MAERLDPDPFAALREAAALSEPGYEGSAQMHEDFKAVFFGDPRGKKVFNQIMDWAGVLKTSIKPDPHMTYFREGQRSLGAKIWTACATEPRELPVKQRRK